MATPTRELESPSVDTRAQQPRGAWYGAAGSIAALFTLGFGALLAAWYEEPSPVDNVATGVIDHAPKWLVDIGKSLFGTGDKVALGVGIVIITAMLGFGVGRASARRFWVVWLAYGALAAVGFVAAADRTDLNTTSAAMILILSVLAGVGVQYLLMRLVPVDESDRSVNDDRARAPARAGGTADRRWFLGVAGGVIVAAAGAAVLARSIMNQVAVAARNAVGLPIASDPAPPVPAGADFSLPGLASYVTSNEEFYRIDTAFTTPRIDPADWSLSVTGHVDEPFSLSYDDLLDMPMVERHVTLACVSNEVGGDLIGNAKWLGVPLRDLLERARPTGDAEQVVGRSVDGFTAGFPLELLADDREALVAVGMNDEPLPFAHGFPARLVVEGVYGYVSATKWLQTIELTTWAGHDGYWIPRGWAKEAPIKTQSRIDVPRTAAVPAGPTVVAGVAWAQGRGISMVELRVDDGQWQEATLADTIGDATWVQWMLPVDLASGEHVLTVRATDSTGYTQTEQRQSPDPDGATGWHSRRVEAA